MKSLLQPVHDTTSVKDLSDTEILAVSTKTPAVFRVLVERWRPRLFARAARVMGNADDAEDVVQETLVRVYKYAHHYQEQHENSFGSWVYTIFYNVAKTYQRRRSKRSVFVNASQLEQVTNSEMTEFPDIAEQDFFGRFLDIDQIASVLARLPTTVARLLRLYILEGRTYNELAESEGVSVGAIRVRLHRARQSFQATLNQDKNKTPSR